MSFLAWLAHVLFGPACPTRPVTGCIYRGRGDRSLDKHVTTTHPSWEPTT